jgi:hypothetical protein
MWTRIKMPPSGLVALACINPNTATMSFFELMDVD